MLQISGSHWINQILKPWPIPDSSGEATLFRQRADQVQYLSDLRYRPDSALRLHLPLHHDTLLAALPPRYAEVLHDMLNRLESSALFTDESCSFSQQDLLANVQLWLDKATQQLAQA